MIDQMFDIFTIGHILSGVLLWILLKKKWQYVFAIFILWEIIENLILSNFHPVFQEVFIDSFTDVIVESAMYLFLYIKAEENKLKYFTKNVKKLTK